MAIGCLSGDCSFMNRCFPAGTLVSLQNQKKNIEEIEVDDLVKAYDHNEEKVTFAKVKQTFKSEWNKIIHLFFGDNRISCTPGHKFWLPEKGKYMVADSLMKGVKVLTLAVGLMSLDSVAFADSAYTAYNFEVENHHNYFVGDDEVLVHNHCGVRKAGISDAEFEAIFPVGNPYSAEEITNIRNALGDDLMKGGTNPPSPFFNYISGGGDAAERAKRVKAWEIVYTLPTKLDAWQTHIPLLTKISDISNNPSLLARLKGANDSDGIEALKKILDKNSNLPYSGCPSPPCNSPWLSNIEDVLQNLDDIHSLYPSNSFVNTIIGRLKGGGIASRRGTVYEMQRILLRNNPNANLGKILPNGKIADYVDDLKHVEFKSTVNIVNKFDPNFPSNDFDQLRGYLQSISSFDNYDLIFDKKIIAYKNGFDPNDIVGIANHAKQKMQTVFQNNIDDIFDEVWDNQTLRQSLFQNTSDYNVAKDLFSNKINQLDNDIFKSIKVE